jgi:hypothetical protein
VRKISNEGNFAQRILTMEIKGACQMKEKSTQSNITPTVTLCVSIQYLDHTRNKFHAQWASFFFVLNSSLHTGYPQNSDLN